MSAEAIQVALRVADILEAAGIEYLVGGSIASSTMGEPRSTMDVDFVVRMGEADVAPLVAGLGDEFLADPNALRRAIRDRSSANLIHYPTMIKIDLFVLRDSPAEREQMRRRQRIRVAQDPDRHLYFCTAEDIVVQKLRWYRMGDETSDRQWRDVLSVLDHNRERLDLRYLRIAAEGLGVSDLLQRALAAAEESR